MFGLRNQGKQSVLFLLILLPIRHLPEHNFESAAPNRLGLDMLLLRISRFLHRLIRRHGLFRLLGLGGLLSPLFRLDVPLLGTV